MVRELTAIEIVDIGKQLEDCGLAFYEAALQRLGDPQIREVFTLLRSEEERHKGRIEKLLADLPNGFVEWRENDRYLEYLASFGHERVFPSVESVPHIVARLEDERQAIELALRFEKQTIEFFNSLRPMVVAEAQSVLDDLVGEEHGHVSRLQALFSSMDSRTEQSA